MKYSLLVLISTFAAGTVIAAQIDTMNLGLRLSEDAEKVIQADVEKKPTQKLTKGSVDIESIVVEGDQLQFVRVNFNFRDTSKKKGDDGDFQYCEARMVPEEQESDPSDILWRLKDVGCHI